MSKNSARKYYSPLREEQANRTRQRILEATEKLLLDQGYARTTIDAIAAAAEVSSQTIYSIFKNKRSVIVALIEKCMESKVSAIYEQSIAAPNIHETLKLMVQLILHVRVAEGTTYMLLRRAGILSPELAKICHDDDERQQEEHARYASLIFADKPLKKGVSMQEAIDISWTLGSRDVFRMLVLERKWTHEAYTEWLYRNLVSNLLEN